MNEPFYTRGISVYLADFFQELVQGGKSDFEARALLIERLADFNTRLIPPLPPGEYLRLLNKIVEAKAPFHFSQPAAVEGEAVPASDLDRAIKWLAAKLRQDRTATFAEYRGRVHGDFQDQQASLQISSLACRAKKAGLGKAKAGRPQRKNKSAYLFPKIIVWLFSRADFLQIIASEPNPEAQECLRRERQRIAAVARNLHTP